MPISLGNWGREPGWSLVGDLETSNELLKFWVSAISHQSLNGGVLGADSRVFRKKNHKG